jgi:hypothetical protein
MVEHTEIGVRRFPFESPHGIQGYAGAQAIKGCGYALNSGSYFAFIELSGVIPERSPEDGPRIGQLSCNDRSRHFSGVAFIISPAVLLPTQKNVPGHGSLDPGEKAPLHRKKTYGHVSFSTESHKKGAAINLPEADDTVESVNRDAHPRFLLNPDDDRLPFFG